MLQSFKQKWIYWFLMDSTWSHFQKNKLAIFYFTFTIHRCDHHPVEIVMYVVIMSKQLPQKTMFCTISLRYLYLYLTKSTPAA